MSSARKQRLDAVFTKAIDMSVNGVGEPELEECFGGIKAKFGAQLQNQYVNMIAKTQRSMEVRYEEAQDTKKITRIISTSSEAPQHSCTKFNHLVLTLRDITS